MNPHTTGILILIVLSLITLLLHVMRGTPLWVSLLFVIVILLIGLTGCTVYDGGARLDSPRLSAPIPGSRGTLVAYAQGSVGIERVPPPPTKTDK